MSVPQIAVRVMRIITSLWPTSGFITSVSVRPGPRSSFANAFICFSIRITRRLGVDDAEFTADAGKRLDGAIDLFGRVRGAHLRADARAAAPHHRERKTNYIHA